MNDQSGPINHRREPKYVFEWFINIINYNQYYNQFAWICLCSYQTAQQNKRPDNWLLIIYILFQFLIISCRLLSWPTIVRVSTQLGADVQVNVYGYERFHPQNLLGNLRLSWRYWKHLSRIYIFNLQLRLAIYLYLFVFWTEWKGPNWTRLARTGRHMTWFQNEEYFWISLINFFSSSPGCYSNSRSSSLTHSLTHSLSLTWFHFTHIL